MNKTPEAKLLELIRAPRKKGGSVAWSRRTGQWFLSLGIFAKKPAWVGMWLNDLEGRPLIWLNRGLLAAALIAVTCLVWQVLTFNSPARLWQERYGSSQPDEAWVDVSRNDRADLRNLTRRNLFKPLFVAPAAPKPAAATMPAPAAPPPPPKIPLSQRAANWRLVGILTGDALQAVMEDRRKQTTTYVTTGDFIDDILVEQVLPDKVILLYGDERLELSL